MWYLRQILVSLEQVRKRSARQDSLTLFFFFLKEGCMYTIFVEITGTNEVRYWNDIQNVKINLYLPKQWMTSSYCNNLLQFQTESILPYVWTWLELLLDFWTKIHQTLTSYALQAILLMNEIFLMLLFLLLLCTDCTAPFPPSHHERFSSLPRWGQGNCLHLTCAEL